MSTITMNDFILILCVVFAATAITTGYIVTVTQKRKDDANKKLNASQILLYSTELMNKIGKMLGEYQYISTSQYESDAQLRGHCINKTVSIITQTLAEHNITIPVDPDVLQSLAALLVEKGIAALELRKEADKTAALTAEVNEAKEEIAMLTAAPVSEDHSEAEKVDLGEF